MMINSPNICCWCCYSSSPPVGFDADDHAEDHDEDDNDDNAVKDHDYVGDHDALMMMMLSKIMMMSKIMMHRWWWWSISPLPASPMFLTWGQPHHNPVTMKCFLRQNRLINHHLSNIKPTCCNHVVMKLYIRSKSIPKCQHFTSNSK